MRQFRSCWRATTPYWMVAMWSMISSSPTAARYVGCVTVLADIVAAHRRAAAADRRDPEELHGAALGLAVRGRFHAALAAPGLSVIAEIKRRSPSRGDLNPGLDPALVAK